VPLRIALFAQAGPAAAILAAEAARAWCVTEIVRYPPPDGVAASIHGTRRSNPAAAVAICEAGRPADPAISNAAAVA